MFVVLMISLSIYVCYLFFQLNSVKSEKTVIDALREKLPFFGSKPKDNTKK